MEAMMMATGGLQFGLVELNQTFFFQIFNTIVLFIFLKKFLFVPVSGAMQKRTDKIKASLDEAASKHEVVDGMKANYQAKLAGIHDEELTILRDARVKAEARTAEMIKGAEKEIEHLKAQAQKEIEQEREKAINQLKDEIASLAVLAASKVIDKELDASKHGAMINDFIERVGDARWHN